MSERIRFIDALRGISLAGIVMAHFGEQYLGFMPPPGRPYNIHGMADGVLEALSWIFVRGKGFGIFSFMFGLSFALQMQRADRRAPGTDFRPRFVWRLLILFAIGWLHGLLYSGDILTVYAALGIPLILFYRVRDRWLLILALLLLIGVPRITQRVVQGPTTQIELQSLQTRMNAEAEAHWQALATGDVSAIVRLHATTGFRSKWDFQFGFFGRGFQTFGLFLLGLWAGRHRVFEDVETHRPLFRRIWRWTGALTLLIPLLGGALFAVGRVMGGSQPAQAAGTLPDMSSWPLVIGMGFFDAWNNVMTLFYVASFALLFLRPRWQSRIFVLRTGGPDGAQRLHQPDRDRRACLLRLWPRPPRSLRQHGHHPDGHRLVRVAGLGVPRLARSFPLRAARMGVAVADVAAPRALPAVAQRARAVVHRRGLAATYNIRTPSSACIRRGTTRQASSG